MRLHALGLSVGIGWMILAAPAFAAASDPVGTWLTDEGKARVEINSCGGGGQLCSKIVWLKEPNDSKGKPLRDMRNKDDNQRGRPILGLPLLTNLAPSGAGNWAGNIYNPEDGNTYKATMQLLDKDRIKLQGCAMFGLICGTKMWTRATDKVRTATPATPVAPGAPPGKQMRPAQKTPPIAEPDANVETAQPKAQEINAAKPVSGARFEAAPAPAPAMLHGKPAPAAGGATVTTAGASGTLVKAVVAKPIPAAAVANAAPVPAGPVAGEDMMFLAAPPPPEETVTGTPMMLEAPGVPAQSEKGPAPTAAAPENAPVDYPASDATPLQDDDPADDDSAAAKDEEGDASPIPPLPVKADQGGDKTNPPPPLLARAEKSDGDAAVRSAKPKKKSAGRAILTARRAAPATRTVATKVTKVTKVTKHMASASRKHAVRTADAKTAKKPEILPWLKDKAKTPPPAPLQQEAFAARPGSFRALLGPAQ